MASPPDVFFADCFHCYVYISAQLKKSLGQYEEKTAICNSVKHLKQLIHEAKTKKPSNIEVNILTRNKFTYYKVSKNEAVSF